MSTNFATPIERPTGQTRLTAHVEERHDAHGDLVWALVIAATTYNRHTLNWLAETLGCELKLMPVEEWA